jgi:SAM-dependent methyltransferase
MPAEKSYVLGTHDEEIARLGLQHSVWRPRASQAWRRAGFTAGQTLVDLGAGPGYASIELAEIVGAGGRVIAIDRSRRFLDHLEARAHALGLAQIETLEQDLDERELPAFEAHGIWSRWLYAFVARPRQLLERAARALRPGGVMVMHEYADYGAWHTSPACPEFDAFVTEVIALWRSSGGEPDIGLDLPRWLAELGLQVRSLRLMSDAARSSDHVWQWPAAFVRSGLKRLLEAKRIDQRRAGEMLSAIETFERTPNAFQITPNVIEIIAARTAR